MRATKGGGFHEQVANLVRAQFVRDAIAVRPTAAGLGPEILLLIGVPEGLLCGIDAISAGP